MGCIEMEKNNLLCYQGIQRLLTRAHPAHGMRTGERYLSSGISRGVAPKSIPLLFRPERRMPDLHPAINVNRLAVRSDINI